MATAAIAKRTFSGFTASFNIGTYLWQRIFYTKMDLQSVFSLLSQFSAVNSSIETGDFVNNLETLPAASDIEDINNTLKRDGGCIIENVLSSGEIDQILKELDPYIEKATIGFDDFTGRHTKRIGALVARSPACRDIVTHKKTLSAARAFLGPQCDRIQLHLGQIIDILPGQVAQTLHRDRLAWGTYLPIEVEPQFNAIYALTDFTLDNGATHLVPGSQTWPMDRHAKPDESIQAVMSKGSVLIYSGTIIHGGGENRSNAARIGLNITYCLGWLRTEENQMLSCPPEIAKDFSEELTDLLGYTMGNYALGYYSRPEMIEGRPDTLPPEAALGRKGSMIPENSLVE